VDRILSYLLSILSGSPSLAACSTIRSRFLRYLLRTAGDDYLLRPGRVENE
jgi:hypothetical protein